MARCVADARRRSGLTLTAVAERSAVSPGYLSQIESGSANPTVRALAQIADALDVDVATLFGAPEDIEQSAFPPYYSPAALASTVTGTSAVWDLTAAGSHRLVARLVHGDAADHAAPSTHRGEEFLIVLAGCCTLHVDGGTRALSAGDACHFGAAQTHYISDASPDLTLAVVMSEE